MAKIETESNSLNIIGGGTVVKGEILCDGDLRIDGTLNGNLTTKGKVVIGVTGNVNGEINCKNSDISGKIEGKIRVSELLSLKSTAKISGDIITNKLAIEPSAVFTGTCNMGNANTPINAEIRKEPDPKVEKTIK
ncbi:MAG: polymer-forming cytoskeletal protein [Bacteroidia bacterium]|nr:polymer-forming cytoskeletal protein [Bacteroidia bacterium]